MGCCNSYMLWFDLAPPTYACKFGEANSDQYKARFHRFVCKSRLYALDLTKIPSSIYKPILGQRCQAQQDIESHCRSIDVVLIRLLWIARRKKIIKMLDQSPLVANIFKGED